jgi:hypothetical protein
LGYPMTMHPLARVCNACFPTVLLCDRRELKSLAGSGLFVLMSKQVLEIVLHFFVGDGQVPSKTVPQSLIPKIVLASSI